MSVARPVRHPAPVLRDELITLAQAAGQAKVSVQTMRGYIASGHLTGYRMGPRILRIQQSDMDRLLREIPTWRRDTAAALRTAEIAQAAAVAADAEADLLTRIRP